MRPRLPTVWLVLLLCGWDMSCRVPGLEPGRGYSLDAEDRVFKSGLFSAFAHDHAIDAPIRQGSLELRLDAPKLRFLGFLPKNRADVQNTMKVPQVLDSNRFTEISFQSTAV